MVGQTKYYNEELYSLSISVQRIPMPASIVKQKSQAGGLETMLTKAVNRVNSRYLFLLLLFCLFVCSCNNSSKTEFSSADTADAGPGDTNNKRYRDSMLINAYAPKPDTDNGMVNLTLVSAGQLSRYKTVRINGVEFDLVLSGTDTTYLATSDTHFQTPEGYQVGTRFAELPIRIQKKLSKEGGWGYNFKLPSGWSLGFCEGSSCTDSYPAKNSVVKWIFKRR